MQVKRSLSELRPTTTAGRSLMTWNSSARAVSARQARSMRETASVHKGQTPKMAQRIFGAAAIATAKGGITAVKRIVIDRL